ncbi:MAG: hypothetical protein WAU02_04675 [Candidatus Saccharimonadales bacterium]
MGFWTALQRIAAGQPVFQESTDTAPQDTSIARQTPQSDNAFSNNQPEGESLAYDASGNKIIPEVTFEDCKPKLHGEDHMEVWVVVQNESDMPVRVEKCEVLGQTRPLGHDLPPHGSREVMIYAGDIPSHDHYKKANLYYKTLPHGDYFLAEHEIRYDFDDGKYVIEDLRLIKPIRDV